MDIEEKINMNFGDLEFLINGLKNLNFKALDEAENAIVFFCRLATEKLHQTEELMKNM